MTKTRLPLTPDLKRRIQARARDRCERCHRSFVSEGFTPHYHHIDEDPANNDPENIRFLCPNCHSYYNTKLKEIDKLMKKIENHKNYSSLSRYELERLKRRFKEAKQKRDLEWTIKDLQRFIIDRLDKNRRGLFS